MMDAEIQKYIVEKEFTNGNKLRNDVIVDWGNIYDKLVIFEGDWSKLIPVYRFMNGTTSIDLKDKITEDELLVVLEGINITNPEYFMSQNIPSNSYKLMEQSTELCMTEVVYYLIEYCNINPNVGSSVAAASEIGCVSILKYLLTFNIIKPDSIDYAISSAVAYNQIECVKILLNDSRLPPDGWIEDILTIACYNGYTEIAEILLKDSRIDPSSEDNKAIKNAVDYNNPECLILLLDDPRVQISQNDLQELLVMSCERRYVDITRVLLEFSEIDPSWNNNEAIKAIKILDDNAIIIIGLFLKDNRVREILSIEELSEYESLLGG